MSMHVCSKRSLRFVFVSAMAVFGSAPLYADSPQPANADAPVFSTDTTLVANLKNLSGKRVTVYLKSGTPLTGTVKVTGDHLLHLEKLDGRDFFDALVSIDQISAIDTRVRLLGR
jgi:hypothetical protein